MPVEKRRAHSRTASWGGLAEGGPRERGPGTHSRLRGRWAQTLRQEGPGTVQRLKEQGKEEPGQRAERRGKAWLAGEWRPDRESGFFQSAPGRPTVVLHGHEHGWVYPSYSHTITTGINTHNIKRLPS